MDGTSAPTNTPKQTNKSSGTFKKPKGRPARRKKVKCNDDSDEDESFIREDNKENESRIASARKSQTSRPKRNAKKILSDSDSD